MLLFQATVSGGLEDLAAEEMMEKLGIPAANIRALPSLGRLYFHYGESGNLESLKAELCSLRCVCHLYVVVLLHPNFFSEGAPKDELLKLHSVAHLGLEAQSDIIISSQDTPLSPESDAVFGCGWQQAVEIWKEFFPGARYEMAGTEIVYGATRTRGPEVQLQERFEWEVNLSHFQLELCRLRPGEFVVDTMCGGGSLGISAGLARKDVFSLNGDADGRCAKRTLMNSNEREGATTGGRVQAVRWDARHLPLRDDSVDVVVVDMPFGKRVGSKEDNVKLYPECIREMQRVLRRGKGRAVILTTERRKVEVAVQSSEGKQYWARVEKRAVFFGGVRGALFSLTRSDTPFQVPAPGPAGASASAGGQPDAAPMWSRPDWASGSTRAGPPAQPSESAA